MPDPYWTAVGDKTEHKRQVGRAWYGRLSAKRRREVLEAGRANGRKCATCRASLGEEAMVSTRRRIVVFFCGAPCYNAWMTKREVERSNGG